MNNIYLLQDRKDRLGSNFMIQLGDFIFCKIKNLELYYSIQHKYKKNLYFIPIIKNSQENTSNYKSNICCYPGVRGSSANCVEIFNQDIISYFHINYKEYFFNIIKKEIIEKNYILPWNDNTKIICIHVRLEDVSSRNDYDGRGSFNYIKNLIENKNYIKYNRQESDKYSLDTQVPIDPQKLIHFIEKFQKEYSEKEIYIITYCKVIPEWLDKIVKKYKIYIFNKNNEDYDLWLMIHSDILVLSKSTYSNIAGIYHQGSQVYYPYWGINASLGLGSKYDKSGWIGYV
jgi:hypothetical protein